MKDASECLAEYRIVPVVSHVQDGLESAEDLDCKRKEISSVKLLFIYTMSNPSFDQPLIIKVANIVWSRKSRSLWTRTVLPKLMGMNKISKSKKIKDVKV